MQRMELSGEEIAKHLEAGKQVTRLALVLDDHVSFVVGEDLVVRKFKLLDGAVDQLESSDREDVAAEFDALRADGGRVQAPVRGAGAGVRLSKAD